MTSCHTCGATAPSHRHGCSASVWPFGDLIPMRHDLIAADPPWNFELYSEAGQEKSAAAHYDLMSMEDIAALPVSQLARGDCLLLLWCCAPTMPQAIDVMKAWGFTYKTNLVWRKVTGSGKVRMGPGYRARTMHETILLGTIGNPRHRPFPSLFDGIARQHSRKPERFYEIVDECARPLHPLDLFSREQRSGWSSFGNEATKFNEAAE